MKISFWVDVFPWSSQGTLCPMENPIMPKPVGAIRYRIDVEIPDWCEEDSVVQAGVTKEGGKHDTDKWVHVGSLVMCAGILTVYLWGHTNGYVNGWNACNRQWGNRVRDAVKKDKGEHEHSLKEEIQ